ncbi:response regulator transcription factor [Lacipirellula parvula]|uniref:response regulator transcription factor n=1 Tax=Lacipirellula parvula TaxID=2650471 RepID=UPI001562C0C3|nr:LuxR C-terminal-related transcriptional regulator [Lacipirellula parvula]
MDFQPAAHIVDSNDDSRHSLQKLVASMGFVAVTFASPAEFLEGAAQGRRGCLILSLPAPAYTGLGVLEQLATLPDALPIIVVTDCNSVPPAVRAVQLGVAAYLQRHCFSETSLWEAIHAAFARDAVQRAAYERRQALLARYSELSLRERHILELIIQGCDHKQIADDLNVSRRTVENRRSKIMSKLGADTFPQLIAISIELGISADRKPGS